MARPRVEAPPNRPACPQHILLSAPALWRTVPAGADAGGLVGFTVSPRCRGQRDLGGARHIFPVAAEGWLGQDCPLLAASFISLMAFCRCPLPLATFKLPPALPLPGVVLSSMFRGAAVAGSPYSHPLFSSSQWGAGLLCKYLNSASVVS